MLHISRLISAELYLALPAGPPRTPSSSEKAHANLLSAYEERKSSSHHDFAINLRKRCSGPARIDRRDHP
jgi:hypothetical protein